MRILHVVPTYLPATRYGGPIYSVHGLAKGLAALGHEVEVFTTNVDGPNISAVPVETAVNLDGVKVTYFQTGIGRRLYRSPSLGLALEMRLPEFDIGHIHAAFHWPGYAAARTASRHAIPYVISPRGMLVKDLVARKSRVAKSVWINLVERRNIEQATAVHVTSALEAGELAKFEMRLPKIIEIANGVDPPKAFAEQEVSKDILTAVARVPYALALGRINWKKNLATLIRAWRQVPEARLIVAGNQEDAHAAELVSLAASEGISDRVNVIARPVLGADKEFLFQRCTVFVLPSLSENFGNAALEAMVRSKPVIATETAGVAAIINAAGCGIVCAADAASLAAAVRRLLTDRNELERMGERGRAAALARYSWGSVAREMTAAYEAVLASRVG